MTTVGVTLPRPDKDNTVRSITARLSVTWPAPLLPVHQLLSSHILLNSYIVSSSKFLINPTKDGWLPEVNINCQRTELIWLNTTYVDTAADWFGERDDTRGGSWADHLRSAGRHFITQVCLPPTTTQSHSAQFTLHFCLLYSMFKKFWHLSQSTIHWLSCRNFMNILYSKVEKLSEWNSFHLSIFGQALRNRKKKSLPKLYWVTQIIFSP